MSAGTADPAAPKGPIYRTCECGSHALSLDVWTEQDGMPAGTVWVDFWYLDLDYPVGSWRTFRQRLAATWRVLRTGALYAESVSLTPENARAMAADLLRLADEAEGKR